MNIAEIAGAVERNAVPVVFANVVQVCSLERSLNARTAA
jgi:hypothetical protein